MHPGPCVLAVSLPASCPLSKNTRAICSSPPVQSRLLANGLSKVYAMVSAGQVQGDAGQAVTDMERTYATRASVPDS